MLKEPTQEFIDLQAAHVTQNSVHGVKGEWHVKKNVTLEELDVFPANISDTIMFKILNFARKYELIAFNAGIKFQKDKQNELLMAKIKEQQSIINDFCAENARITEILESALEQGD